MDKMRRFWIGADPGGKDRFGLAFVDVSGAVRCETVSSVDEAVQAITSMGKPLGLPPMHRREAQARATALPCGLRARARWLCFVVPIGPLKAASRTLCR